MQQNPRRHPPLGRDRDADRSAGAGQQARRYRRRGLSRSARHDRTYRRARRLRRSSGGAVVLGSGRTGHSGAEPSRHRASPGIHRAAAFQDRRRSRVRPGHLRHEGRRVSGLSSVSPDLRRWRADAARHHASVWFRRGDRQPDLARTDRGRGAQGKICAGDGAGARGRQDRHRAQGRGALRGVHQGRALACRHAAAGRPQRDPRTRPCHPHAGSDERCFRAASR